MKSTIILKVFGFFLFVAVLSSCLDGDDMNTPPGGSSPFLMMTYNATGGTLVNSGLRYFGSQALLYPPTNEVDTAVFAVALQGTESLDRDVNLTLQISEDALDDYYYGDSLVYEMMPSSYFELINTTATISKGQTYAEFKVKFFPNKMDFTKNTMLPITVTNAEGLTVSSNYGFVYFHVVGNPIAGAYSWDFIRCSTPDCANGPDGQTFYGGETIFAPVNGTTVTVPTGYYDRANYIITFDDNDGVLSNWKAVINPESVKAWTDAGITIATGPTITVEENNTKFTIKYTTLTRNCTDVYYKP